MSLIISSFSFTLYFLFLEHLLSDVRLHSLSFFSYCPLFCLSLLSGLFPYIFLQPFTGLVISVLTFLVSMSSLLYWLSLLNSIFCFRDVKSFISLNILIIIMLFGGRMFLWPWIYISSEFLLLPLHLFWFFSFVLEIFPESFGYQVILKSGGPKWSLEPKSL